MQSLVKLEAAQRLVSLRAGQSCVSVLCSCHQIGYAVVMTKGLRMKKVWLQDVRVICCVSHLCIEQRFEG